MRRDVIITFFVLISIVFFNTGAIKTQSAINCLTITTSSSEQDKNYCKNELAQIEAELAELLQKQKEQQKTTGTLKGDVDYLTSQINALKTKVKARALAIAQLKVNIREKESKIKSLSSKIQKERESLAQLIRNTNEFDNENLIGLILSDDTISSFYSDLESYSSIKKAVKNSIDIINGVKVETEVAKQDLEKKQDAETDAKAELESAEKKVAMSEAEKKKLLSISQQTEAAYQLLAAEKKAQADKIRNALFTIEGRGIQNKQISFGEAYNYAKFASEKTGVRAAFILAIMQQESGFGNNVGGCYVTDGATGNGIYISSGLPSLRNMVPGNFDNFVKITSSLGLDWKNTPISCAQRLSDGSLYGYGGAMGYTQFIPNSWMLVEARVKKNLNVSVANPWNAQHAVMATAIFVGDKGAAAQTYTSERAAACGYYGSCSRYDYGTQVMNKAKVLQIDIDKLELLER